MWKFCYEIMCVKNKKKGLQEATWIDIGRAWGGFGKGLGKDLGGFGTFSTVCGQILDISEKIGPCWGRFYNWTPALIREASQFEISSV